jgi:hypothetical protein
VGCSGSLPSSGHTWRVRLSHHRVPTRPVQPYRSESPPAQLQRAQPHVEEPIDGGISWPANTLPFASTAGDE